MQAAGEPIRYRPLARDIDTNTLRVPAGDQFAERLPLSIEIAACPSRTVGGPQWIAVHRQTLERAVRLAVEDEHGGTPRRKRGLGHQAEVDRIFGVFAVEHQPHIEPGLGHQPRQQPLQPVCHHLVFRRHAFAGG